MKQAQTPANSEQNAKILISLGFVITFAFLIRIAFFNGFLGGDDLTYFTNAYDIANGVWEPEAYNGALRFGYNIPSAFFIHFFGVNIHAVNAWSLLCSLAEIGAVFLFAAKYFSTRAALLSALILATAPLHMAVSTRIHVDPVMAFFLTSSFILFYCAEDKRNPWIYFMAGLFIGSVFWAKEVGIVTALAFVTYPLLFRRINIQWVYVVAGGMVMLIAHLVLIQAITGDPFHLIKVVTGQVQRGVVSSGYVDSPFYYFDYLFKDIKHTWLAPFAVLALVLHYIIKRATPSKAGLYVAWWLTSLLLVMSFLPISFDPIRFVMKQSNYLNLFLAPIALLAGFYLDRHFNWFAKVFFVLTLLGGICLGAFEQQSVRVFTANSMAAVEFIKQHPNDWILGSSNNGNIAAAIATLEQEPSLAFRSGYLAQAKPNTDITYISKYMARHASPPEHGDQGFAVFDPQTINWGQNALNLASPPSCWKQVETLAPPNLGMGQHLIGIFVYLAERMPVSIKQRLLAALNPLQTPEPAVVYRVDLRDLWCDRITAPS